MIDRATVWRLGFGQLVCWGVTYYLVGVLGQRISADFGWSLAWTQGGFALGLLTMGLVSPLAGQLIDAEGGRRVMTWGSMIAALGCLWLAAAQSAASYYAAWVIIGVAMRFTLYDAAFAALARIGGAEAKRAMAQITLLGGFASTTFWPLGDFLADQLGWRGAAVCYAVFALLTAALHRSIPEGRFKDAATIDPATVEPAVRRAGTKSAAALYAVIVALTSALNSAMSAHMIGLLVGLGLVSQTAVFVASLRGFGQTGARGCQILFGGRLRATTLNLVAAAGFPVGFGIGLWAGESLAAAVAFSLLFGASNGLMTITRGTLPLALFDASTYGAHVGRLIAPSFLLSAAAPLGYALVLDHAGAEAALWLSAGIGFATAAAAIGLLLIERHGSRGQ